MNTLSEKKLGCCKQDVMNIAILIFQNIPGLIPIVYEVKDNTVYIFSLICGISVQINPLPFKVCIAEVVQNTSEFNRQPK